ncbi:hypothetical protein OHZ10_10630 [Burkholderia arboris]|uniref:Uncharacterized protein n=1 Tax=Burkholderia arboris TaxID=488730 RepID=A0ABZ3DCP8_9BURK|nr:hypothetical protein [Burkholderia cenocepacia]
MKNAAISFLLVVLIEAVSAVATYLKQRLTGNLRRSDDDEPWANHREFT